MNYTEDSDAARRKRPAARRAVSEPDAGSTSKTRAQVSQSEPHAPAPAAARTAPGAGGAAGSRGDGAKRVTARRTPAPSPTPAAAASGTAAAPQKRPSAVAARPASALPARPAAPVMRSPSAPSAEAAHAAQSPARPRGVPLDVEPLPRAPTAIAQLPASPASSAVTTTPGPRAPSTSEVFSPGFFLRKWGRLALWNRSEHVDDFGLDPTYEASVRPFFEAIYSRYFRTEIEGIEHIPGDGRALLVCNHGGALPWDGIMLRTALRLHHASRRELPCLVEDHVFHAPFLGSFVNRIGAVRACQENAERLLSREELLAVFPEGIKGIAKPYSERYKLQRFGRGGYVRLALRTGTPVIPVAIVGADDTYPLLYKVSAFSKSIGLPFIPVTPTFPWLGPLGIAPLPSRWRISIGAPIQEIGRHEADAAKDEVLVHELNECARAAVRKLLDGALEQRGQSPFV